MTDFPDGFVPDAPTGGGASAASSGLPAGFVPDAPAQQPSVLQDAASAIGSGLKEGVLSLPAIPGDVQAAAKWAGSGIGEKLRQWTGKPPSDPNYDLGGLPLPTTADIERTVGFKPYQAQTALGQTLGTVASFVPGTLAFGGPGLIKAATEGGIRALAPLTAKMIAKQAVLPGAAAGAAGSLANTVSPAAAPWARAAGAVAGPMLAHRLATPFPIGADRAAAVDALRASGVQPTAGQVTGNGGLRALESEIGGATNEPQLEQFTTAALRKAGEPVATRTTPDVMDQLFSRNGRQFDQLAANNELHPDQKLYHDLIDVHNTYEGLGGQAPIVGQTVDRLMAANSAAANVGGTPIISGATYQAMRSELESGARASAGDPKLATALRGLKNALDDNMERSIQANNPSDLGAWQQTRGQYRNILTLDKAAEAGGENAALGLISPAQLRIAAKQIYGGRSYVRGKNDLGNLARAGQGVMTPFPNSGTATRTWARNLGAGIPAVLGGFAGQHAGGYEGAMGGIAAGAAAPYVAGKALMSPWVQKYLANQAFAPTAPTLSGIATRAQNSTLPFRQPPYTGGINDGQ